MKRIQKIQSLIIICLSLQFTVSFGATLPSYSYNSGDFEGFSTEIETDPMLMVVDPDTDPQIPGDPCPCAGCGGTLVHDPKELALPIEEAGLTCDNPTCPCDYYVDPDNPLAVFWGFPVSLNDDLQILFALALLYALGLTIKLKIKAANNKDFNC